ncbi:MAG TPA: hypothetical protein EYQ74_09815 [Planctomycetes bacterium]|nr:hypothetical protein [Planctomycetota bacterium]HIK60781.1 hypothetical protein [Planctomycetota bacterium]
MNCRKMEEGVFLHPAVAGPLTEHFIEARLHVDYPRNMERELEMTGSNSQPLFLVVDPASEEVLGRHDGPSLISDEPFIQFLDDAWAKREPGDAP